LSDEDKKRDATEELKKKLGVASANLPAGTLPRKVSNAPLPSPGSLSGGVPLPGLGNKPSYAPLPKLGDKPAPIPPFMRPSEPPQPSPEEVARDPFGKAPPRARPSYAPGEGEIRPSRMSLDPKMLAAAEGSKRQLLITALVIGFIALIFGYMAGSAVSKRVDLSIAIRDARIVDWEIRNSAKLFNDVQTVLSSAYQKARAGQIFDGAHLGFVHENVHGNPIPPRLFTDRNYKKFDPAAVHFLAAYNNNWTKLNRLIVEHKRKTNNDKGMLASAKAETLKLLTTNYGVIFSRDPRQQDKFIADLVILGALTEKQGKPTVSIQLTPGTVGDERELLNPEPDYTPAKPQESLYADPDKYVVEIGLRSKNGLLKNTTISRFEQYALRLKEIMDLMKTMTEEQGNLLSKLTSIASQEPPGFLAGGIDVHEDVEKYIASRGKPSPVEETE
jgi:hypothetical protein